jgi:hypothetical protein
MFIEVTGRVSKDKKLVTIDNIAYVSEREHGSNIALKHNDVDHVNSGPIQCLETLEEIKLMVYTALDQ